ncbi:MAG: helix-turn-helix domain-containing protein [Candidatus Woesearchaeota archaeon]
MDEVFAQLGLSAKETKIYLALVKLGSSSVEELKKETKIERTHIYKILERLRDKNFVNTVKDGRTLKFSPVSPRTLIYELEKQTREFKTLLPQLETLAITAKRTETPISVYRGIEGFKRLGEEVLATAKRYCIIGDAGQLTELMPIYSKQFVKRVECKKIRERILVEYGKKIITSQTTKVRYLPQGLTFPSTTIILPSTILIINWSEPVAIRIDSQEIATAYKNQFEALWKNAKQHLKKLKE